MRSIGVIPARIGSTRLPAKPLIKIADRCLLQWVISAIKDQCSLDALCVATDDKKIAALAEQCGVEAIMTDPELASGTDRVFAAIKDRDYDIVFNIQGDEPLVQAAWVENMLKSFADNPTLNMATVATDLPTDEFDQVSTVKVIRDQDDNGIYFSRFAIPYTRQKPDALPGLALKHIGLYGFRKKFLQSFCEHPAVSLEKAESLEQLRALYMGERIRVLKVSGQSIGIDTAEDIKNLEKILQSRGRK